LAVQEDLSRAIVTDGIRHPVDARTKRQLDRPFTERADANDAYLRGLHLHRLKGEANYQQAQDELLRAVKLDPSFALAYASLASTFTVMTVDGYERPTAAWPAANRAVRRALELDAELPEAHSEQSSSWFFFDHDWSGAESAWKRATNARPSPTLPDLLGASSVKLFALGRTSEALALTRRGRQLDPVSPGFAVQEADLLLHDDQVAEAEAIYRSVLDNDPTNDDAWFGLAAASRAAGRSEDAVKAWVKGLRARGEPVPGTFGTDERAYEALERATAELELRRLIDRARKEEYFSPFECARARVLLGDLDRAFHDLDAAGEEQSPGLVFLRVDRAWRSVRHDPRFVAVLDLVGLP
jgi:serine/threonine-protein kinase